MIVGWAQLSERGDGDPADDPRPDAMLSSVARAALARSGAADALIGELGCISAVDSVAWPIPDQGRWLASELGAGEVETVRSRIGGCAPIDLLGDACSQITAGRHDAVLIAGVELVDVLMRASKEGRDPGFPTQEGVEGPDRFVGSQIEPSAPIELAAGLIAPVAYYPLFENAIRRREGRDRGEHIDHVARIWARFAAVAAENPYAWSREAPSAETIATATPANRQVSIPYTKLMNSNIQTNQAAALVVCSAGAADRAGIDPANRISVLATAAGADHHVVAERPNLDRSPALRTCVTKALDQAGVELADVRHLDLYSCFPSAVQIAGYELGIDPLDPARSPTVTGGLAFAGGPGNNYVTHSLAAVCERIATEGGIGMATSVSWYLTKHGVAVLGEDPAEGAGFAHIDPQAELDAGPRFELVEVPDADAVEIESYTAMCNREGAPELGMATFLLGDGRRTVAKADDADSLAILGARDCLRQPARLSADGRFHLS